MAQQVIPAAQLVPKFHTIERCNNYTVMQSIPCSPGCKIVGQILLDHPLLMYLLYILQLPVETPDNPFVAPINIETIEVSMNKVGYQGVVDKVIAFYTKNLAQPWQTMFNVFNRCLTTRTSGHDQTKINILQLFHAEICATDDFKEYQTVFMKVDVPMNQSQPIVSTQGMHRSTPRAHRTPTLTASPQEKKRNDDRERNEIAEATLLSLTLHKTSLAAEAQENIAKVQKKLAEEEIEKLVEGDEDEESYASEFADSVLNDDVDDSGTRLEPGSHKENPEKVDDDDEEIKKEKKDDIEIEKEKKDDVEIEKD
ncbi:hypothetical protein Tco_1166551 [Tanacetum coccineum]